jgi:hypothetical protein
MVIDGHRKIGRSPIDVYFSEFLVGGDLHLPINCLLSPLPLPFVLLSHRFHSSCQSMRLDSKEVTRIGPIY